MKTLKTILKNKFHFVWMGLSLVFLGLALFINKPQCPDQLAQQQISETGCIVGANIGQSLLLMAAALTLILGAVVSLYLHSKSKK